MKGPPIPPKRTYKNRLEGAGASAAGAGYQAARKAQKEVAVPPTDRLKQVLLEASADTVIGKDVEIKGRFEFSGLLRLEGRFEGSLHSTGDVLVCPGGVLIGDIPPHSIRRLVVNGGHVFGSISVEQLGLAGQAVVKGAISCKHMEVDEAGDVRIEGPANIHPFAPALLDDDNDDEAAVKGRSNRQPQEREVAGPPQQDPPPQQQQQHRNPSGQAPAPALATSSSQGTETETEAETGVQTGDGVEALRRERVALRQRRKEQRRAAADSPGDEGLERSAGEGSSAGPVLLEGVAPEGGGPGQDEAVPGEAVPDAVPDATADATAHADAGASNNATANATADGDASTNATANADATANAGANVAAGANATADAVGDAVPDATAAGVTPDATGDVAAGVAVPDATVNATAVDAIPDVVPDAAGDATAAAAAAVGVAADELALDPEDSVDVADIASQRGEDSVGVDAPSPFLPTALAEGPVPGPGYREVSYQLPSAAAAAGEEQQQEAQQGEGQGR